MAKGITEEKERAKVSVTLQVPKDGLERLLSLAANNKDLATEYMTAHLTELFDQIEPGNPAFAGEIVQDIATEARKVRA